MTESRAITPEEGVDIFMKTLANLAHYWGTLEARDGPQTPLDRCNGLAFSILSLIDGSTLSMPAIDLVPSPCHEDKEYAISEGENWWEGLPINGDVMLHELWHSKYERKR